MFYSLMISDVLVAFSRGYAINIPVQFDFLWGVVMSNSCHKLLREEEERLT